MCWPWTTSPTLTKLTVSKSENTHPAPRLTMPIPRCSVGGITSATQNQHGPTRRSTRMAQGSVSTTGTAQKKTTVGSSANPQRTPTRKTKATPFPSFIPETQLEPEDGHWDGPIWVPAKRVNCDRVRTVSSPSRKTPRMPADATFDPNVG